MNSVFFYIKQAENAANKSVCFRPDRKIGAVAVKDNKIICEAANGFPEGHGMKTCRQKGFCKRKEMNIPSGQSPCVPYCVCAEQKLICSAAKDGFSLNGAEVYCTHRPCSMCTKLLICSGVKRVYYKYDYPDKLTDDIAAQTGFELIKVPDEE